MARILITGMSGTGKSSALAQLSERGYRTVDTDTDEWSVWISLADGTLDWVWREDVILKLLTEPTDVSLFISGCKTNQGVFHPLFEHVVLLSAPSDVLIERVVNRTNNPYGKTATQRQEILEYKNTVEPKLRASSTAEIDTSLPLSEVVNQLMRFASPSRDDVIA